MKKTIITPNALTVFRIIMTIVVIRLVFATSLASHLLVVALFTIAALTDYYDGELARKTGQITTFGKIVDPIADKLLMLGMYIAFSMLGIYSFWWLVPIIIREVLITILRFVMLYHGVVVAAEKAGKAKVYFQILSIAFAWFYFLVKEYGAGSFIYETCFPLKIFMYMTLAGAVGATVYSGLFFFIRNSDKLSDVGMSRLVGSFFFFGRSPYAPGTVGSLAALLLYYPIRNSASLYVITILIVFIIGTWSARKMCVKLSDDDPQEVVIDEVVGMLIALFLIPCNVITVISGFALFRLFDIIKPWPIKRLESIKNGYGVMLDDVLAGVFANIVLQIVYYKFLA